jgi:peroxiredoxin
VYWLRVITLAGLFGLAAPAFGAEAGKPKVGKPAPDFTLPATQVDKVLPGKKKDTLSLKDLRGKNVVLYFFPKAMTRG